MARTIVKCNCGRELENRWSIKGNVTIVECEQCQRNARVTTSALDAARKMVQELKEALGE